MNDKRIPPAFLPFLASMVFLGGYLPPALADAETSAQWVKDGATVDGGGTIYLSTTFTRKSGTFRAMPDSIMEDKDSVSGTFLVGTYRMVADKNEPPMEGMHGKYDELISTELMDCDNRYAGTLRRIEMLAGKIVYEQTKQDNDILMIQSAPNANDIGMKLCRLHKKTPSSAKD